MNNIEEEARKVYPFTEDYEKREGFVKGAKSEIAKKYWQEQLSKEDIKKTYIISYQLRMGTGHGGYGTFLDKRQETLDLTKEELKQWIQKRESWEDFKILDIKTI